MIRSIRRLIICLCTLSLLQLSVVHAAPEGPAIHVYVNDSCIVADEAYFIPTSSKDG